MQLILPAKLDVRYSHRRYAPGSRKDGEHEAKMALGGNYNGVDDALIGVAKKSGIPGRLSFSLAASVPSQKFLAI
ncbi:MAG: hypothetical protein ABI224_02035 [Acetobacteraceae bacterium]